MASGPIESDGRGVRRVGNHEINMIPMIDLLVCCISFLLITAVWSRMARVDSSAMVPGDPGPSPALVEKKLHVDAREDGKFTLAWKVGSTVISSFDVVKNEAPMASGAAVARYLELGAKVADEWRANGGHRDSGDRLFDQAVLHTGDKLSFGEIVAIIDAIHAPKRVAPGREPVAAFNVTFATN